MFSIDTLRADRLGAYGYGRATSPRMDALARAGIRFETVIAESNWTLPSHTTLFTGMTPDLHGVGNPGVRMADRLVTLPETLNDLGFVTIGVTGGSFMSSRYGFDSGFDFFRDEDLPFGIALELAAEQIETADPADRFFAFIHTFDVHCPYDPPEDLAREFRSAGSERIETHGRCGEPDFNSLELSPAQVAWLSDRYDAGIRWADQQLDDFLTRLERNNRLADTLVVIVSDHGEEFWEHGRIGHRETQYIESLRVPWIIAGPGIEPSVVLRPVGLVDVFPTLLALLGIDNPTRPAHLIGEPKRASDDVLISRNNWGRLITSVVAGEHHAIYRRNPNEFELFNWREDPTEQTNLVGRDPDLDRNLQMRLIAPELSTARPSRGNYQSLDAPTQAEIERLRALGYMN